MKRTVVVILRNHFDNTWRRCWDRPYENRGRSIASYVTVERAVLDEVLRLTQMDRRYCFDIESSRLLRRYIEDHPGTQETFRRLWQKGQIALLGSGEIIPDANMVRGETLVRNLAEGIWWAEEALGRRPTVGWHADGFGSSAQMPQVFAGCGMRWIAALSYKVPSRAYWRGLDGTSVFIGTLPNRQINDYVKYPPCPACAGRAGACRQCAGTGLHFIGRLQTGTWHDDLTEPLGTLTFFAEESLPPLQLPEAIDRHEGPVTYQTGTHETLADLLADRIAACNNPPEDEVSPEPDGNPTTSGCLVSRIEVKRRHRFAEAALVAAEALASLTGRPDPLVPDEMPRAQRHSPGRIAPWERRGHTDLPPVPSLRDLWRDLAFGAFHDALPGTHIDPAYDELMDLYDHLEDACAAHLCADGPGLRLFNATAKIGGVREIWPLAPLTDGPLALRIAGRTVPVIDRTRTLQGTDRLWADVPDLAPGQAVVAEVVPAEPAPAAPGERATASSPDPQSVVLSPPSSVLSPEVAAETIEWSGDAIGIAAGSTGIEQIRLNGRPIALAGALRIGELIVEHDVGDPWATRDPHRPRRPLAVAATRVSVRRTNEFIEITYAGSDPDAHPLYNAPDPMVLRLNWTQRWRLYAHRPYADVRTQIDWSCYHRRIRLAFPTGWPTDRMWTEVPYGALRRDRYEMDYKGWNNAGGDWPAVGWAAIEHGGVGLAVLNRGTPSHRCEDGTLLISVLRSPAFPNCLEEPNSYSAPDYERMRDPGVHVFDHRVVPYAGRWQDAGIVDLAEAFNSPLPLAPGSDEIEGIQGVPPGVCVSAIKPARTGEGIVIRLAEMTGKAREFLLRLCGRSYAKAVATNLLEDDLAPIAMAGDSLPVRMKPWEVLTIKMSG
jgi:hypothetical protein